MAQVDAVGSTLSTALLCPGQRSVGDCSPLQPVTEQVRQLAPFLVEHKF